jgi:ribonuclease Z
MEEINVFGGQATLDRVADLIYRVVWRGAQPPVNINLVALQPGMTLVEDEKFRLSAFPVSHRGPDCYGFLFEEKSRRPFLVEKAEALGIPFGPERGRLVRGERVTLADGRTIHPEDVLGETIPGVRYVHIADVGRTNNLLEICRDADAMTIEATYLEEDAALARQFGHLTAAQAAHLARTANVKSLLLTHISRRYYEKSIRSEAQLIFPNSYVVRDFDHFQVTREGARPLPNRQEQYRPGEHHDETAEPYELPE